jgi:hypothetical protein
VALGWLGDGLVVAGRQKQIPCPVTGILLTSQCLMVDGI